MGGGLGLSPPVQDPWVVLVGWLAGWLVVLVGWLAGWRYGYFGTRRTNTSPGWTSFTLMPTLHALLLQSRFADFRHSPYPHVTSVYPVD